MAKKVTEIRLQFPDESSRSGFESAFQDWLRTYQNSQGKSAGGESAQPDVHRIGFSGQSPAGGGSPELIYVDFIPGF